MTENKKPQSNGEENTGAPAEMEIDSKEVIGTSGGDEEVEAMETEENTGKKEISEVEGRGEGEGKKKGIMEEQEYSPVADEAETGERTPKAKKTSKKKKENPYSPPPSTRPQRERKTAERFHCEDTRVSKVADFVVKQGGGTPLKDIPNIVTKMSKKTKNDDIIVMFHSLLYSKRAKPNMLRKNILEFSGFPWTANEAKEREKVKDKLERYTKEGLHQLLDILVLPKGGKKDEQIERILDFLQKPVDLGNSIKESKKRKTPSKAAAKSDKKPPKSEEKAKIVSDEEEKDEEEEKESPPAKRPRTSSKSMSGSPPGKRKATPTEPILRKRINGLLQDADVKKMSVDEVIESLEGHFVGDLHKKKDLIKRLMDESISAMEEEGESNDEGEAADEKAGETKEKEDSKKAEDSLQVKAPAGKETVESGENTDLTMDESNSKVEPEDEKEEPAKEVGLLTREAKKEKELEIVKEKGEMEVDDVKTENGEEMESVEDKMEKIVADKQQEPESKEPQQDEKDSDAVVEKEKTASDKKHKQEEKPDGEKIEPNNEVVGKETPVVGDQQAENLPELTVNVGEPMVDMKESMGGNETGKVEEISANQETVIVEGKTVDEKVESKEECSDKQV